MPNWCDNYVELTHEDPKMIDRVVQAFGKGQLCEEFIPSPNGEWDWNFSVENWGTKWDVGGEEGDMADRGPNNFSFNFQSAWSPPMGLYNKLVEEGFKITAFYYEPGMCYVGKYQDGEDECYEYESAQDVIDNVPAELDEMFGISENLLEWEENDD